MSAVLQLWSGLHPVLQMAIKGLAVIGFLFPFGGACSLIERKILERMRQWLKDHGILAVIPERDDQRARHHGKPLEFDKKSYRRRSIVEQCVGWIKECRRIGTRFEKLAVNFLAMVKLAMIQRYLRFSFSDRT